MQVLLRRGDIARGRLKFVAPELQESLRLSARIVILLEHAERGLAVFTGLLPFILEARQTTPKQIDPRPFAILEVSNRLRGRFDLRFRSLHLAAPPKCRCNLPVNPEVRLG